MPAPTFAYIFEEKILNYAMNFNHSKTFMMIFDSSGNTLNVHYDCPVDFWHDLKSNLEAIGASYLFFDHFEPNEFQWLQWGNVSKVMMENLIKDCFSDSDFFVMDYRDGWGKTLPISNSFPESWNVMFDFSGYPYGKNV